MTVGETQKQQMKETPPPPPRAHRGLIQHQHMLTRDCTRPKECCQPDSTEAESERAEMSHLRSVCSNDNGGVQRRQDPEVHRSSAESGDLKGDRNKTQKEDEAGGTGR